MRHLCDSNVFLALVTQTHAHHRIVQQWFDQLGTDDTAELCRMTQSSLLRLLTTDQFMHPYTPTNAQALSVLRIVLSDTRIRFADEPLELQERWHTLATSTKPSPKLWMDAYLAAFAELSSIRFVTLDKAFHRFKLLDLLILSE